MQCRIRRLRREAGENVWVFGYSNDVMAYIPSERVLKEKQVDAFAREAGGALPALSLLNDPPPRVQSYTTESLEAISRLAGGLVVEMGPLGEELRLEILKSRVTAARAHHPGFDVPEPVLTFIAKTVTHNGRDLEGALKPAKRSRATKARKISPRRAAR